MDACIIGAFLFYAVVLMGSNLSYILNDSQVLLNDAEYSLAFEKNPRRLK